MASLNAYLGVFFTFLCCSSALTVPSFCEKCYTNVEDPQCIYCCRVNVCCVDGVAQPYCGNLPCGCPQPETTETTTTTTTTTAPPTPPPRDCALPGTESRIMGGSAVSVCDRPWMVHFMAEIEGQDPIPTCSGVLISSTQILTSKPCVDEFLLNDFWSSRMFARFADSEKFLETQRQVTPENVNLNGNIAIVTVRKVPVDSDFCIKPVCLPDNYTVFTADDTQECKMASWGLPNPFDKLQESNVKMMDLKTCNGVLSILAQYKILEITVPEDGICSNPTDSSTSACKVDEGGMLLCKDKGDQTGKNWILAGITYGTPCDVRAPSTFVNVTQNLDFIMSNLEM